MLDGAVGVEGEIEVHRHEQRDEGNCEDKLDPVAHDEGSEHEHGDGGVEENRAEQAALGVAEEGFSVGAGHQWAADLAVLAEALEGHEVAAEHPVGDDERDWRNEGGGHHVPAEKHAQRIVDGFGEDVEVGDILGAEGRYVVEATHDPESCGGEGEMPREGAGDGDAEDHHQEPLAVGCGDADQTSCCRTCAFKRVFLVEGGVQHLVEDIVAACDEGGREKAYAEVLDQCWGNGFPQDAERKDDAGEDKNILNGVIKARDA